MGGVVLAATVRARRDGGPYRRRGIHSIGSDIDQYPTAGDVDELLPHAPASPRAEGLSRLSCFADTRVQAARYSYYGLRGMSSGTAVQCAGAGINAPCRTSVSKSPPARAPDVETTLTAIAQDFIKNATSTT